MYPLSAMINRHGEPRTANWRHIQPMMRVFHDATIDNVGMVVKVNYEEGTRTGRIMFTTGKGTYIICGNGWTQEVKPEDVLFLAPGKVEDEARTYINQCVLKAC